MKIAWTLAGALALVSAAAMAGTPSPRALADGNWRIVRIDGKAPVSPRAALRFAPGRLSITAGCNGMGGTWRIERGRLIGGPFMSTMMFCEGLMDQERALADLVGSRPAIDLTRGKLTLTRGAHSLEAVRVR